MYGIAISASEKKIASHNVITWLIAKNKNAKESKRNLVLRFCANAVTEVVNTTIERITIAMCIQLSGSRSENVKA
jgi:hypothetical protein